MKRPRLRRYGVNLTCGSLKARRSYHLRLDACRKMNNFSLSIPPRPSGKKNSSPPLWIVDPTNDKHTSHVCIFELSSHYFPQNKPLFSWQLSSLLTLPPPITRHVQTKSPRRVNIYQVLTLSPRRCLEKELPHHRRQCLRTHLYKGIPTICPTTIPRLSYSWYKFC